MQSDNVSRAKATSSGRIGRTKVRPYVFLLQLLFVATTAAVASPPVASIWYRGTPPGVPQQDELAQIRALGFSAVTWPAQHAAASDEVRRMAAVVDLTVLVREKGAPLTSMSAANPGEEVDVQAASLAARQIAPLVWRAIAHGARAISFDAGQSTGTGLRDRRGRTPAWIAPASAIARQLEFNHALIEALQRGPAIVIEPPAAAALDLELLEVPRSWVLIATNTSAKRVRAVAHLPKQVPYALWVNVLDGSSLAMLNERAGPRWQVDLKPWEARVYLIDKVLR